MLVCRVSAYVLLYCLYNWYRQCSHVRSGPSIPAYCTECMSKYSRTLQKDRDTQQHNQRHLHKDTHTHARTLTLTHTDTQVVGANRDGAVFNQWGQGYSKEAEAGLEDDCCDKMMVVSCSRTETAGHHCCCWAGQGDPGRTAVRPGWSAQEEAYWHTERKWTEH